jgi:hypothetical protein
MRTDRFRRYMGRISVVALSSSAVLAVLLIFVPDIAPCRVFFYAEPTAFQLFMCQLSTTTLGSIILALLALGAVTGAAWAVSLRKSLGHGT